MTDAPGEKGGKAPDTHEDATVARQPLSVSRIDKITEDFARLLSRQGVRTDDVLAGRYRIIDKLGDGGMGQVFVAENLSIGNRVAVKVLKADLLLDASFRQRFQHEAEAVAAIVHQNVVRLFDLVVGDPTFLVMEYLVGPTLAQVLKQHERLEVERAIEVARRLCLGLDAAHRAGVVHRDIKPSNVVLVSDAENGEQPKLIDFGVAKVEARPTQQQLTLAGQLVGTPHYMSPEQITGAAVDARTDVYALGCVFYHLVAGRPPFTGKEEFQILSQQVHQDPVPLSRQMDVPYELDQIVARAMAKEPDRRFPSMREMAEALAEAKKIVAARAHARTPEVAASPTPAPATSQPAAEAPPRPGPSSRPWLLVVVALAAAAAGVASAQLPRLLHRAPTAVWRSADGLVLVASDPPGATVELDGARLAEATPTAARGVAAGAHTLIIRHGSRPPVTRRFELAAGERLLVEMALPPSSRTVAIQTVPSGARVYLDRSLAEAETPLTLQVGEDDLHELRIEKLGYEIETRTLSPDDHDGSLRIELRPEKSPRGRLTVDANVSAEVWIDGVDTGFSTPTISLPVAVGTHRVEVRSSAGSSASQKINVRRGEALRLTLTIATASAKKEAH